MKKNEEGGMRNEMIEKESREIEEKKEEKKSHRYNKNRKD